MIAEFLTFLQRRPLYNAWLFCTAILVFQLSPLLFVEELAGWDVYPHFYLLTRMAESLSRGSFLQYDRFWYAGYPLFTLYPPLAYALVALPKIISFGLIPLWWCFKVFQLVSPWIFLWAFQYCAASYFGDRCKPLALFAGLLFLTASSVVAHTGVGLAAQLQIGFFPNFFALPLLLLLLGLVERARFAICLRSIALIALCFAALILSHHLTAVFGLIAVLLHICMHGLRSAQRVSLGVIIGVGISAFWWMPFLSHMWLGSGRVIGLLPQFSDPLFILYPEISLENFSRIFFEMYQELTTSGSFTLSILSIVELFLLRIPFNGLLLLCIGVTGFCVLIREKSWYLPILFAGTLLLLPRSLFLGFSDLTIHYYRFAQNIFLVNLLLVTFGTQRILEHLSDFRTRIRSGFLIFGLLLVFTISCALQTDVARMLYDPWQSDKYFVFSMKDRSAFVQARGMEQFLAQRVGEDRVLSENARADFIMLGSPHYFATRLPLAHNIEMANGLLVESSLSAGFINSTAILRSDHLQWGRQTLAEDIQFNRQSFSSMIQRLGLYNIKYIIASTRGYAKHLLKKTTRGLSLRARFGKFALFQIHSIRPKFEATSARPWLFVEKGGLSFREFSERWFSVPEVFDFPVAYTPKDYRELPVAERDKFEGIILGWNADRPFITKDFAEWSALGVPVVVLDAVPGSEVRLDGAIKFIPSFRRSLGAPRLIEFLRGARSRPIRTKLKGKFLEPNEISFQAQGATIINYTYSPDWESLSPEQTVYAVTPSLMMVFGHGSTNLKYKP